MNNINKKSIIFLFSFIIFFSNLKSQDFPFKQLEHVGNQYGLINNYFSDIVKDNKGRFWLGGLNGLVLFDGFKTKTIKFPKIIKNQIVSNSISKLYLENDSILLICHTYGVCSFNINTNEIKPLMVNKESMTQSLNFYFIFKDQSGDIWISTRELGLQRYDKTRNIFDKTGNTAIDTKERVYDYEIIDNIYVSFSHSKSLSIYNSKTHELEVKADPKNMFHYLDNDLFQGRISSSIKIYDQIYISRRMPGQVNFNFFSFNIGNKDTISYDVPSILGRKFFKDSRGNIWIYNEGISVIEKSSGKLFHVDTDDNYGFSMCNKIYEDEEHNLWFCTNFGLFVYHLDNIEIVNFSERVNDKAVGHIFVDAKVLKDGTIALATYEDGLLLFDNNFKYINLQTKNNKRNEDVNNLSCLIEDKDSVIWLGNVFGKLVRYNKNKNTFNVFENEMTQKSKIVSIHERKSGELIIVTQAGRVVSFHKENLTFKLIYDQNIDVYEPIDYVSCSYLYNDSLLLIGSINKGLFSINLLTSIKRNYRINFNNPNSISSNVIFNIDEVLNRITVSHENGFDVYDPNQDKFSSLLKNIELPFSDCYTFVQISSTEIAANTSDGFYRINPDKGQYYRIGRGTILDKSNFRLIYLQDKSTYIFITDSYIYYFKDKHLSSQLNPKCFLYSIQTTDTIINYDGNTDIIRLRRDQNTLRFTIGSNSFRNKAYLEYLYKIEGETEWININENREILFNNLRGGDYKILIKCFNKQNNKYSDEIQVKLQIKRAFHETSWFYVLLFVILSIVVYIIYRIRINRLLAIERVRFKLSRDLHDDMGSTLSTINILSGIIKSKIKSNPATTYEYIDKISSYSQDMMENMNDIVWSLNPSNDSMPKVIYKMREFAINILEPRNIRFVFNISGDADKFNLKMEDRRDFFLIFKEVINNAAKYSNANLIEVKLNLEKEKIKLTIIDNGKGFVFNEAINGNGLANIQRRALSINGQIEIKSSLGNGCFTELIVPRK